MRIAAIWDTLFNKAPVLSAGHTWDEALRNNQLYSELKKDTKGQYLALELSTKWRDVT